VTSTSSLTLIIRRVGLNYFGPVQVAVGRRREKRYVALNTCLTTRALHLEIIHDPFNGWRMGTPSAFY
jgi:hypothetical protein